jgi:hypothetical protein
VNLILDRGRPVDLFQSFTLSSAAVSFSPSHAAKTVGLLWVLRRCHRRNVQLYPKTNITLNSLVAFPYGLNINQVYSYENRPIFNYAKFLIYDSKNQIMYFYKLSIGKNQYKFTAKEKNIFIIPLVEHDKRTIL